ncbi:MAG: hypothetical protein EBU90_26210 [Proteobacteria bacterium]|nr:hypothetical protein [Pseudomonadota bacterium]
MAGKGKPPVIPPEHRERIISDITLGKKRKCDIAREYGVTQASIDGMIKRYKEATNLNDDDFKKVPQLAEQHLNAIMQWETNFKENADKYKKLWDYHYSLQIQQRLKGGGYDEGVQLIKKKILKMLHKETVAVVRGLEGGGQVIDEREIDIQDAKHLKELANTYTTLSYLEGIHTRTPTVAMQNNQINNQGGEVVKESEAHAQLEKIKTQPDFQNFVKDKLLVKQNG